MILARRNKRTFTEHIRETIWPSAGWSRSLRYFGKRILRLSGSPHAVATGFAAGIFVGWSPLFGFHYLMAVGLSLLLRGNVLAAVLSTTIANPVTLPALLALDYKVGAMILGHHPHPPPGIGHSIAEKSMAKILPVIEPLIVGWVIMGTITALASYFIVGYAVRAFQHARRERLHARRMERMSDMGDMAPL
ncbi:MAG: DUF2062 domain-containing protein [Rhizobiales bacterium]|nr:DUF2062 domain-containing protein [Hyphomicrobiales bacterium]MBN9008907.1 DUF2062 domain-containing protein [Hyphomicrobiales bacterium]